MRKRTREQERANRLTAVFAGLGVGAAFGALFGLLLQSLAVGLVVGAVCSAAAIAGLNTIRKESREVADDTSEPGA
ncbi:hypothetical protein [Truepera radiovictrix]|uniref:Uncharacterized protein n=1 Tax=Truepera radiovictrix (strain DSM 17093 / CIP 108686 / LMG 22925 / RQ-24) TaxID=649638 RepID=D7CWC8_TRURR|nr:hypothetical protein [Truepera radiovictrix]ADI16078.1 hypothetical protein Trad_2984 [Truepera radiovictrix DSM 17093]WMT58295.1 hypothetical protein RCV51_04975 [Truepera radiovictrix]